jgi:hypothetical protein
LRLDSGSDFREGGVRTDAVEPIASIAEIRFAPVHYAVDKCAIRIINVLGDCVRGVKVIMPQQHDGPRQL